jgi:hypothetical protein
MMTARPGPDASRTRSCEDRRPLYLRETHSHDRPAAKVPPHPVGDGRRRWMDARECRRHDARHDAAPDPSMALPHLRLRPLPPGVRAPQGRLAVHDQLLRMLKVLCDVPQSRSMERRQLGTPQCRSPAHHRHAPAATTLSRPTAPPPTAARRAFAVVAYNYLLAPFCTGESCVEAGTQPAREHLAGAVMPRW